jgi:hypothetical protein
MSKELLECIELASMATLFIFASIVAVGLVCESEHFSPSINWAGECLVVIGVVGETLALGCIFFSSRRLLSIDAYQLATVQKRAADAELEATRLGSIITGLNLTPLQLGNIAKLREQFRGARITVGASTGDATAGLIAWQIRDALEKEAGLKVSDISNGMRQIDHLDLGIHIYSTSNDRLQSAIMDALNGGIMPVFHHPIAELPIPIVTSVTVLVCVRPIAIR